MTAEAPTDRLAEDRAAKSSFTSEQWWMAIKSLDRNGILPTSSVLDAVDRLALAFGIPPNSVVFRVTHVVFDIPRYITEPTPGIDTTVDTPSP